ncbi:MAG TPA: glycosyltransferase [Terracidiphilus sp.]|jgi:glycosyltransferase involved in cell wall biosynthesis|nr:glycosyltransferase [Terracidiphilus sp.]
MRLTVLSIAFPFAPVGSGAVGGAERILSYLDEALVNAGDVSLVVACEGSRPAGKLFAVPLPEGALLDEGDRTTCVRNCQAAIDHALESYPVDVIHMHGMDVDEYVLPETIPVLMTLHLPVGWYRPAVWTSQAGRVQFCCVSQSQRRSFPLPVRDCVVVENGVALPPAVESEPKQDFALMMGRICPEKNAHAALEAATQAGVRVVLAGQAFTYRDHQRYMHEKIEPLLKSAPRGIQHSFVGPVSLPEQQKLMAQARCLLHPTLAPETSSLVAMEALAAGTPVIAYPSGALPEIVEDGVTGFLVHNVQEMAEAICKVDTISRQACRRVAERRFNKQRMVGEYFALYEALTHQQCGERLYA